MENKIKDDDYIFEVVYNTCLICGVEMKNIVLCDKCAKEHKKNEKK